MIGRLLRRFLTRFRGVERFEVLAVAFQAPLFAATLAVALLGREIAAWALLTFLAQGLIVAALLVVIESVRTRRPPEPVLEGLVDVVTGATPGTEGWGVLHGQPGDRRTLLERIAQSLPLRHLTAFAVQNDSELVYDAIALTATEGRFDAAALAALGRDLASADGAPLSAVLGRIDPDAVVALARAMQAHAHPGLEGVLNVAFSRRTPARPESMVTLAQGLLFQGRTDEAATVLADVPDASWDRDRLLSDLINPFTAPSDVSVESWLATVNQMYLAAGLEPLHLDSDESLPAFDRIRVDAPAGVVDGPLVTVIMSTFRPGPESVSAARSILSQTWRNLELLVMDDGSEPEHDDVLTVLAELDDRITVVRAGENSGTYVRRNDALRLARGDYVTIQDSDDWSHPRRLELQVRHLEASKDVPANLLSTVRVSPELRFTQPRGTGLRLAEPSLMFRRGLVVGRIGQFDTVRRAADSEFRTRIERAFGLSVPRLTLDAPAMLQRFEAASLSGSDFGAGWTHPARFAYRSAYLAWQRGELRAGRVPRMDGSRTERPFPAPPRITGAAEVHRALRVVLAGDGRSTKNGEASRLEAAVRSSGLSSNDLAFLHLPSLRSIQHHVLETDLQLAINEGVCGEILIGDQADIDLLVIGHADAVLGLPRSRGRLRARRVVVLADPELELSEGGLGYAVPHVEESCRQHFGVTPEIVRHPRHAPIDLTDLPLRSA